MLWLKSFASRCAALCLVGLLASCGFVPIAAERNAGEGQQALAVRDLQVDAGDERFRYELRRELLRFIVIDPSARRALRVTTRVERTALAITATDEITRYNLEATTVYRLVGIADDEVITRDARSIASVNATTDAFATQASERAAMRKLAESAADKILTGLRALALEEDVRP